MTFAQAIDLRNQIPHGQFSNVAKYIGLKRVQNLNYYLSNPSKITKEMYTKAITYLETIKVKERLGEKRGVKFDDEQVLFYYKRLNNLINSREFSNYTYKQKLLVLDEQKSTYNKLVDNDIKIN